MSLLLLLIVPSIFLKSAGLFLKLFFMGTQFEKFSESSFEKF